MSTKLEVEQKFFCQNIEELIKLIEALDFKDLGKFNEIDEYFSDINSIFIQNRTCLRIRKTDNKFMELTHKGKSINSLGKYAKIENNLNIDVSSYNVLKNMLFSLDYFSYCIVDKTRIKYSKEQNDIEYNILIDYIKNIGYFIEFELLAKDENKKEFLMKELQNFIKCFSKIRFDEANLPYRDFVAKYNFEIIKNNYNLDIIYTKFVDSDKELSLKQNLLEQLKNKNIKVLEYNNQDLYRNLLVDENCY